MGTVGLRKKERHESAREGLHPPSGLLQLLPLTQFLASFDAPHA